MGKMGYGYGSECHLLRWMGRHRKAFDVAVLSSIKREGSRIERLDFEFKQGEMWPDAELKGMDFLKNKEALQKDWNEFWPVGRGIRNWDAVGWVSFDRIEELLLVEAKAHIGEIKTDCQAKHPESIKKIEESLGKVKNALGVPSEIDWMKDYYQVTNRIAFLHFLHEQKIPSHLLFIYFIGDLCSAGRNSPQSEREWQPALETQKNHIGLPKGHSLENWIHELFLKIDSEEQQKG
ncbi:MAG TPA: hypothetical protein VK568_14425 [Thermodesulfobacteriota bacterium]|nr:hypothetical protein [Thermodesulfobacteriota bacterium]